MLMLRVFVASSGQVHHASLSGNVSDPAYASVPVESLSNGFRRETTTSSSGVYQLPGVPVGSYTVSIQKIGFDEVRFDTVVLTVG